MTYETLFLNPDDILQFNRQLAVILKNVNDAIILNQINYWLKNNEKNDRNYIDGRYWVYNSYAQWVEQDFPFWSPDTIKRSVMRLEQKGILISANYNKKVIDKTKWYSIDYQKLQEIIDDFATGQIAPTTGQNAPTSSADCTDQEGKLHQPIPENTTYTSTKTTNIDYSLYNGAKSEFCTTAEFSFDVVERQIRKACSEQCPFDDVDTVVAIFKYYYSMYYENVGEHHPRLKQENVEDLVYRIVNGTDIVNGYDIDTYIALIDEHFATNYSKEPDWNINHFLGGDGALRDNRFYETCY